MDQDYNKACYLFGDVVDRMFEPLVAITNTYRYVSRSIEISSSQIILEDVDDFGAHALDPNFERYFPNREEIVDGTYRHRVGEVVYGELQAAKRRVASSSLVFAHAVFEECISDCLKIAFAAAPADWLPAVRLKKVSLGDVSGDGLAVVQREAIISLIEGLDRQSIMKKLDIFFQVTRPSEGRATIRDYQYNRERIEMLDLARHKAAHDDPTAYNPDALKDDIEYLRMTLMYLLAVLIDRYDVRNLPRPANG